MKRSSPKRFVVCIGNDGRFVSLEKWKIYVALPDATAQKHGMVRVVDESARITFIPKPCSARSPCPTR